jgi:hypothetical protein
MQLAKLTAEERLERKREFVRRWRKDNREKSREAVRRWQKEHPKEFAASVRMWEKQHPLELSAGRKARSKTTLADICELCGAKAQHRHHPDYSKPLLVIHLCARCHKQIHACKHLLFSNV